MLLIVPHLWLKNGRFRVAFWRITVWKHSWDYACLKPLTQLYCISFISRFIILIGVQSKYKNSNYYKTIRLNTLTTCLYWFSQSECRTYLHFGWLFKTFIFIFQLCKTIEVLEYYKLSNSCMGGGVISIIFRVFNIPNSDLTVSSFVLMRRAILGVKDQNVCSPKSFSTALLAQFKNANNLPDVCLTLATNR